MIFCLYIISKFSNKLVYHSFKAFLSGKSSEEIARGLNIPVEGVEDLVM